MLETVKTRITEGTNAGFFAWSYRKSLTRLSKAIVVVATCFPALANVKAQILLNGGFEDGPFTGFLNGAPRDWTYVQGDGAADLQAAGSPSPFGYDYDWRRPLETMGASLGNNSVYLTDGGLLDTPSLQTQVRTPAPSGFQFGFSMDFRLAELTGNPWDVGYDTRLHLRIDAPGNQIQLNGVNLLTLSPDIWYHLEVTALTNWKLGFHSMILITPQGGSPMLFDNIPHAPQGDLPPNYMEFRIWDGSGADDGLGRNAGLFLDNVRAKESDSIPEPSAAAFLIAALTWFGTRRLQYRLGCDPQI